MQDCCTFCCFRTRRGPRGHRPPQARLLGSLTEDGEQDRKVGEVIEDHDALVCFREGVADIIGWYQLLLADNAGGRGARYESGALLDEFEDNLLNIL